MRCEFIAWRQGKFNTHKDVAGDIIAAKVDVKNAKQVALYIDEFGKMPLSACSDFKCAIGHGVTVVYPNGKTKTFRHMGV